MNPEIRIVTIGGGSGAPVVLRALMQAGFSDIKAICAAMDTGGLSGRVRTDERDRVISVGDLFRNFMALIPGQHLSKPQVQAFLELIDFIDGRGRNLGYTIYYALLEKYHDDFLQVQQLIEQLLQIKMSGMAIPVTLTPTNIHFLTQSGQEYVGEHQLDLYSMSKDLISKVWIEPRSEATDEAKQAIRQATHIIYCPGSLYGSVICNFLPKGITAALDVSQATKILVTNLVSTRHENHYFKPLDYWRIFKKYTHTRTPFEVMVVPDVSRMEFEEKYPKVAQNYDHEHSYFQGWDDAELQRLTSKGVRVVKGKIYTISPQYSRIRHHPKSLAKVLKPVLVDKG